jgi:flavin reductase (DIM6/NTAB) family NADH-FMN oxidoreductase RutF/rubredoxin
MILPIFGQKFTIMEYKAFHKLSYGLYIIASEYQGKKSGYIGNTAFQVTSSPPQIAISCHKKNDTSDIILKSGVFSLSVLRKEVSTSLIGEFGFMASSEIDKFAKVKVETHTTGAPIVVESVIAWLECRVVQTLDVGSHTLIIGEVADSRLLSDEEPLTYDYYREKYKMLAPRNAPTYIEKEKLDSEKPHQEKPVVVVTEESGIETADADDEDYICTICGYVYNPEEGDLSMGIPPGTPFSDLPEDYRCPICNADKDYFKPVS